MSNPGCAKPSEEFFPKHSEGNAEKAQPEFSSSPARKECLLCKLCFSTQAYRGFLFFPIWVLDTDTAKHAAQNRHRQLLLSKHLVLQ